MSSRERFNAARGNMRPPSAPPTTLKRKERDYEQDAGDETNINVVVRCRGRSEREVRENSGVVVGTTAKGNTVELSMGPNAISNKEYTFDKVFSAAADQAIIFENVVSPILKEMLAGYNCTIFAYGQTGTGKTYTMSGDMTDTLGLLSDNAGIIPRVLYALFQKLENDGVECSVKCSFIELYNEELRDLLSTDDSVKLKIYDDSNRKSQSATIVQGMEESHIKSATAGIKLLQQGSHRRQVAATKCNDLSSRSHTVFTITTYVKKTGESSEDYICSGKLNLVDLAGSENIQRSGAENKRAAEAGLINKSLLTLGRVINALVDKSQHIPYRESKLTRLLQDSLGGRTKTCIIATVSPSRSNLEETISTLDYAFRAKNIRNKPQINSMISKKTLLKEFTAEIEKLKSELIATRQRNGVYLTNEQYEEITVESESRRILSEEQKGRIETIEAGLRNKGQELFNLAQTFASLKKDNEATKTAFDNTKDVLAKTDLVLKMVEKNLAEETTLRMAHQTTELRLRGIGSKLISTVDESIRDIEGLNAKLRRRSQLHKQNQESWTASAEQAKSVSHDVETRISSLKDDLSAQLTGLSQRVETFVVEEVQRLLSGKQAVAAGSANLEQRTDIISKRSSDARDGMNDVLEEIKDLREDVKDKVGEGLHGLSEAAARISGEVISELDQFHTQLHASYSGLGKEFKQMFEEITQDLVAQREESDRLRTALQEANRKNIESSIAATVQLESRLENERRTAELEQQQLLQQMTRLVRASASRRDQRLSQAVVDTKSAIIGFAEDLEQANDAYSAGMDCWNGKDTALLAMVNSSKDTLKVRMKSDWTAVETRNAAIQESTKAVHQETVKIVEAQMDAMATQMAALDEFVTRARRQNDDNYEEHVQDLEGLNVHINSTFQDLQTILDNDSAEVLHSQCQAQIDELAATVHPLEDEIRQPLQNLTSHLTGTTLAEYIPTGETPQRKIWSYPTELPQTNVSTTPPSEPPSHQLSAQTPSRMRSPRKSPKKMASPRKIVKDVYVDSPMRHMSVTTATASTLVPLALKRSMSARSVPAATHSRPEHKSLKELDLNTTNHNHTVSLPITPKDQESLTKDAKQMDRSFKIPQLKTARSTSAAIPGTSTTHAKTFSASVGHTHTLTSTNEEREREREREKSGKENFQPSKSVQLPSSSSTSSTFTGSFGGRKLRSGHVSPPQG